jgi:ABC-type proline/glycine betaine transport system permease subunit
MWAMIIFGPVAAAYQRAWPMFWALAAIDLAAFAIALKSETATAVLGPLLVVLAAHTTSLALLVRFPRRDNDRRVGPSGAVLAVISTMALAACGALVWLRVNEIESLSLLLDFPAQEQWRRFLAGAIDSSIGWMVDRLGPFFNAITAVVSGLLNALDALFVAAPWPIVFALCLLAAWRVAGSGLALFVGLGLLYLAALGFWEASMSTLSLVMASAIIAVVIGLPVGILCARSEVIFAATRPVLDFMQVMPTFVYLIPAVAFFSIGKPPAVLATVIFALPPMIRLTALGLLQVPPTAREAGLAFGATNLQLLIKVELPLALPTILAGVNQVIVMCLSMVVIASMIGAGGLGYDVLVALRNLKTGDGFLAGIAIVICAMILDRLVQSRPRHVKGSG